MIFFCASCEQVKEFDELKLMVISADHKKVHRYCRVCRSGPISLPDVYFDGKPEHNLSDDPVTGKPRVFLSKGHKAAHLKERGIVEAGDPVHGAPVQFHVEQNKKIDTRHEVRMALKHVEEMGQDNRRQEYLRITKQGR